MPDIFRFEDFELNRNAYELRCSGWVVHLERIPLDVLFLLADRRGQLVTRQEIIDAIWGKHVVGDVDNGINTAIRKIRRALKDTTEQPRFLFTIAGKGYRFDPPAAFKSAPVPGEQAVAAVVPAPEPQAETPASAAARKPRRKLKAGVVVIVMILLGAVLIYAFRHATHLAGRSSPIMLAVLPFVNLSGDPQQEYFVDGLTEEIIAQMGGLDPRRLGVIARTTAMQYKNTHQDVGQIAHELGVDFILEGSVRKEGGRVRVTGQLIQASDQTHLWAGSYDGDLSDILKLQSAVAGGIAGKIRLTLSPVVQDRVSSAPSVNTDAYEAYLRGLQALNLRTPESLIRSIAELGRAIVLDPNYAPAYAALAHAYSLAQIFGGGSAADTMPKARSAALRALQLDDSLAEAHATLAFVRAHYEYDWVAADHEFRRALELNPSDPQSHFFYSNTDLSCRGRHDEAIAEMRMAVELDPLSLPIQAFVGRTYLWARRYNEALAEFQKTDQIHPNVALVAERLAHLYTYMGAYDKAIDAETRARVLTGEATESALRKGAELRAALAKDGPRGYWQVTLKLSESANNPPEAYTKSYGKAIIYARLGEHEKALAELEKAYTERILALTEIKVEPAFDVLRTDHQFLDLIRRVGLSQ